MNDNIEKVLEGESEGVVIQGDCLERMKELPDNSIDSVITDGPYGLSEEPNIKEVLVHWLKGDDYEHNGSGFCGNSWDSFVPGPSVWKEVYRVMKPGALLLAFGGTRTSDLQTIAIRMAGFSIKDKIEWIRSGGFPKSLDISKSMDQKAGADREVTGPPKYSRGETKRSYPNRKVSWDCDPSPQTAPATPQAEEWSGHGTAISPSQESITVAMKPLDTVSSGEIRELTGWDYWVSSDRKKRKEGKRIVRRKPLREDLHFEKLIFDIESGELQETIDEGEYKEWNVSNFVANALKWGVAGFWIDGGRIATTEDTSRKPSPMKEGTNYGEYKNPMGGRGHTNGRWPKNLIFSHHPDCKKVGTHKVKGSGTSKTHHDGYEGESNTGFIRGVSNPENQHADEDGMETVEKWECVDGCPVKSLREQTGELHSQDPSTRQSKKASGGKIIPMPSMSPCYGDEGSADRFFYCSKASTKEKGDFNNHPTTKPLDVLRYLCRLTKTPDGGIVLDPFAGSGTTALAAKLEDRRYIMIEKKPEYVGIIEERINRMEIKKDEDGKNQPIFLSKDQAKQNAKLNEVFSWGKNFEKIIPEHT